MTVISEFLCMSICVFAFQDWPSASLQELSAYFDKAPEETKSNQVGDGRRPISVFLENTAVSSRSIERRILQVFVQNQVLRLGALDPGKLYLNVQAYQYFFI